MKATLEKAFGYQGDNMRLPVQRPCHGPPILRNRARLQRSIAERYAAQVGRACPRPGRDRTRGKRRRPDAGRLCVPCEGPGLVVRRVQSQRTPARNCLSSTSNNMTTLRGGCSTSSRPTACATGSVSDRQRRPGGLRTSFRTSRFEPFTSDFTRQTSNFHESPSPASARSTARTSARRGRRRTLRRLSCTRRLPPLRCSAGSVRSATTLAAMPSRSAGSWRKPVTPCVMTSGSPPTFDATTGTSHAMASSAARPKLSCAEGSRKTSADESSGITSSCAPSTSTERRDVRARGRAGRPFRALARHRRAAAGPGPNG